MGTGSLPARADSTFITQDWFNTFNLALELDQVPRNSSGVATDIAGGLGQSALRFLKAFIASGYWVAGDMKIHHSYNGAAPPGEGWMLCDGRIISQANYDTEHGSGHWTTFIGSSPLNTLYLPDFTNNSYPTGAATTPQTGTTTISRIGNNSNVTNLSHSHTVAHSHSLSAHTHAASAHAGTSIQGYNAGNLGAGYATTDGPSTDATSTDTPTTNIALGTSQNIQPDSIVVQYYMRII